MDMATWKEMALAWEERYGSYIDWEERFVECGECGGEPIYECDYPEVETTFEDGERWYLCPVCETWQ